MILPSKEPQWAGSGGLGSRGLPQLWEAENVDDDADGRSAAVLFADQALFDLLTLVCRTDTVLADDQEKTVLARLHALAAELTRPAAEPTDTGDGTAHAGDAAAGALGTAPRRRLGEGTPPPGCWGRLRGCRRWGCLLEYAVHRAARRGRCPPRCWRRWLTCLPRAGPRTRWPT
ncbi:hypothetical protein [Streptomyces sp. MBT84]|uniref:hypothetical protein n=1 Tax=Streptomyces sp. MBT84 TaxID=1488414 RepID=UPI001C6F5930|nr:hypothetical protein [Streptomyces sp. MBT84]